MSDDWSTDFATTVPIPDSGDELEERTDVEVGNTSALAAYMVRRATRPLFFDGCGGVVVEARVARKRARFLNALPQTRGDFEQMGCVSEWEAAEGALDSADVVAALAAAGLVAALLEPQVMMGIFPATSAVTKLWMDLIRSGRWGCSYEGQPLLREHRAVLVDELQLHYRRNWAPVVYAPTTSGSAEQHYSCFQTKQKKSGMGFQLVCFRCRKTFNATRRECDCGFRTEWQQSVKNTSLLYKALKSVPCPGTSAFGGIAPAVHEAPPGFRLFTLRRPRSDRQYSARERRYFGREAKLVDRKAGNSGHSCRILVYGDTSADDATLVWRWADLSIGGADRESPDDSPSSYYSGPGWEHESGRALRKALENCVRDGVSVPEELVALVRELTSAGTTPGPVEKSRLEKHIDELSDLDNVAIHKGCRQNHVLLVFTYEGHQLRFDVLFADEYPFGRPTVRHVPLRARVRHPMIGPDCAVTETEISALWPQSDSEWQPLLTLRRVVSGLEYLLRVARPAQQAEPAATGSATDD